MRSISYLIEKRARVRNVKLNSSFLAFFFQLLYNQFAWAYNIIALIVSSGMWFQWVNSALPFLDQEPILEIGFGTGRLLNELHNRGNSVVGLDRSMHMVKLVRSGLQRKSIFPKLVNGSAHNLPFCNHSFHRIASTFPTSYILERKTLLELWRVLAPGGQVVIVPTAWITGKSIWRKFLGRLFQITHQPPTTDHELDNVSVEFSHSLQWAGFIVQHRLIELPQSKVHCILAKKPVFGGKTRLGY